MKDLFTLFIIIRMDMHNSTSQGIGSSILTSFLAFCMVFKTTFTIIRYTPYANRLITIAQISPVKPIIVSIIVHDFKVVFSSISSRELTSQNPESFT